MLNSPVDCKGMMKNPEIERLASQQIYEVLRFPAYWPDELVMKQIRLSDKTSIVYFIAMMNGIIPIVTIGGNKSFVVDFKKKKKPQFRLNN